MANPRVDVAELLTAALPATWRVDDTVHDLDGLEPDQPVVMVGTASLTPHAVIGLRTYALRVLLVEPSTDPGDADDALDSRLDVLLDALDDIPLLAWTNAERATFADSWPAYEVTVTVTANKE